MLIPVGFWVIVEVAQLMPNVFNASSHPELKPLANEPVATHRRVAYKVIRSDGSDYCTVKLPDGGIRSFHRDQILEIRDSKWNPESLGPVVK